MYSEAQRAVDLGSLETRDYTERDLAGCLIVVIFFISFRSASANGQVFSFSTSAQAISCGRFTLDERERSS